MDINILTKKEAISLAKQQFCVKKNIKLVAMDYNWGPPISGRFDKDRMNFWAKVKTHEKGKLFLQGKSHEFIWNINIEFKQVDCFVEKNSSDEFMLYKLSLGESQSSFPVEFVLRYETDSGIQYYDNNEGNNYHITPWKGCGSSAICDEEIIFDLEEIKGYRMNSVNF